MESVWDREYDLLTLDKLVADNQGKDVTLCTVRSPSILETKLGNIFWGIACPKVSK